jgi:hypothetical protein
VCSGTHCGATVGTPQQGQYHTDTGSPTTRPTRNQYHAATLLHLCVFRPHRNATVGTPQQGQYHTGTGSPTKRHVPKPVPCRYHAPPPAENGPQDSYRWCHQNLYQIPPGPDPGPKTPTVALPDHVPTSTGATLPAPFPHPPPGLVRLGSHHGGVMVPFPHLLVCFSKHQRGC